jgi:hypothetical protein
MEMTSDQIQRRADIKTHGAARKSWDRDEQGKQARLAARQTYQDFQGFGLEKDALVYQIILFGRRHARSIVGCVAKIGIVSFRHVGTFARRHGVEVMIVASVAFLIQLALRTTNKRRGRLFWESL